jgi:hypothetical protein
MVQLSATRCSCFAILWVTLVSFAAITLCVASERVFIVVVVYFVIDSVRKLLDTPSYINLSVERSRNTPVSQINDSLTQSINQSINRYEVRYWFVVLLRRECRDSIGGSVYCKSLCSNIYRGWVRCCLVKQVKLALRNAACLTRASPCFFVCWDTPVNWKGVLHYILAVSTFMKEENSRKYA